MSEFSPQLLKARITHSRLFFAALLPVLLFTGSSWVANTPFGALLLTWVGIFLIVAGMFIRVLCTLYVGGRKNDVLVDIGCFSVVRNPLYVGSFIALLGVGLQTASLTLTALLAIGFMLYYPRVVAKEEAFLQHQFGDAYAAYCARVPRWIPKLSRWSAPEEITVKQAYVLRTFRDAVPFVAVGLVLQIIQLLQLQDQLPVIIYLP